MLFLTRGRHARRPIFHSGLSRACSSRLLSCPRPPLQMVPKKASAKAIWRPTRSGKLSRTLGDLWFDSEEDAVERQGALFHLHCSQRTREQVWSWATRAHDGPELEALKLMGGERSKRLQRLYYLHAVSAKQ